MMHEQARRPAPQISIAMTTFNGARFIGDQLASIAAQSQPPLELVLSDDGSTDATLDIVEAFAATAPFPVRIAQNDQRLGYAANFIQTASRCTGALIAFCDQDDIWRADKLATMQACFTAHPGVLLAYHNARLVAASGEPLRPFYDVPPSAPVAPALSLPPWHFGYGYSQVFRRELLSAAPYWHDLRDTYHPERAMGHDLFFFTLAATLGDVAYLDDMLVDYRQHAAQTIGTSGREAPGLVQRWLYRLEDRRQTYAHLAQVAGDYAALLGVWRQDGTMAPELGPAAMRGIEAWHLLSDLYRSRETACAARSPVRRFRALRMLDRQGAYGDGFWTFGRKARLKDAVLGVMLAPLVGRFGRPASAGDPTVRRGRDFAPA